VRSRWDKTVFALESLAVERIGELVELNDGITEFTTLEASIEVVIANTWGIANLSRCFGRTGGSHESDCVDRFCLKKPQPMNCVGKFIFSIIVVFGPSSDLCHVFGSNIKNDVGDGFGVTRLRWFSGELPLRPVKHLSGSIAGYRIINSNRYELELSSVCWMGSVRMGTMEVVDSSLGVCNVQYRLPSLFFSRIALPMDKVLHLSSSKSRITNEVDFIMQIALYLNWRWRWRFLLGWELRWSEWGEEWLVEDRVYSAPSDGEREFISTFAYLSFDRKGAVSSIL
jgi:hypothetical protein